MRIPTVARSAMRDEGSRSLALAGKRILITRAPHQTSELVDRLRLMGATPVLIPTIEIGPPGSFAELDSALRRLAAFDLVAFTSANAVRGFSQRAATLGIPAAPGRIAVVGPATAKALDEMGLQADVMPELFTAEALARTLQPEARGRKILLLLAEAAPAILETALTNADADVTVAAAYRNQIPEGSLAAIAELFGEPARHPDAVTFTSASTAHNLIALLEPAGLTLPDGVARVSIGPITSRALVEYGFPPHIEAAEATIPALVDSVNLILTRRAKKL